MTDDFKRCIEPQIYPADATGASFAERRAILLGKYVEKELNADLENQIREHLDRCDCCTEFVRDFQNTGELRSAEFVHASCPSSPDLDRFVFGNLPQAQRAQIAIHLTECPLCKEESEWLQNLRNPSEFSTRPRNWLPYAAIAAALFFMAISLVLFSQRASIQDTEGRLRAAAVIKAPQEINFTALRDTSVALPEKMHGIYQKGVEALKRESYQEAIRHLEIVMTSHPDHSGAIYLLGYSYYQMQEPERAFELCERAERMSPHSLERCLSLVNIALKTGHFTRAIEEINGLHHAAPDHPEIKATYERIKAVTHGRTLRL